METIKKAIADIKEVNQGIEKLEAKRKIIAEEIEGNKKMFKLFQEYLTATTKGNNMSFSDWLMEKNMSTDVPIYTNLSGIKFDNDEYIYALKNKHDELSDKHDELCDKIDLLSDSAEDIYSIRVGNINDITPNDYDYLNAFGWFKGKEYREAQKKIREENKKKRQDDALARIKAKGEAKVDKILVKKDLKAKYGTGSEYRKAKREAKKEIKAVKKELIKKHGGTFVGRSFRKAMSVMPQTIIMRNSFLACLRLNVWNLAAAFAQAKASGKNWDKILQRWGNFGGNETALVNSIEGGKLKPPLKISFKKGMGVKTDISKISFEGQNYLYPTGVEEGAALTTGEVMVAIATPIIGALMSLVTSALGKDDKDNIKSTALDIMDNNTDAMVQAIMENPNLTEDEKQSAVAELQSGESIEDVINPPTPTWVYVAIPVGVIGLSLLIYAITRSGKKS